jgi:putative FmdB family regulatory protein
MPLYEFRCRACREEFEALVRPHDDESPRCPACGGADLDQLLSSFAVSSQEKTQAAVRLKRRKEAKKARQENMALEREIERHRREDH